MNTAVILAARKEQNSCIPYPLKEFFIGDGKKHVYWNVSFLYWKNMVSVIS